MSKSKELKRKMYRFTEYCKNGELETVGLFSLPLLHECIGTLDISSKSKTTKQLLSWDINPEVLIIDGVRV